MKKYKTAQNSPKKGEMFYQSFPTSKKVGKQSENKQNQDESENTTSHQEWGNGETKQPTIAEIWAWLGDEDQF